MNPSAEPARAALADHLMAIHPHTAAIVLERAEPDEVARWLDTREPVATTAVLARMVPERAARVLAMLGDNHVRAVLSTLPAPRAAAVLAWLDPDERARLLELSAEAVARELRELLAYPPNTAGALMDPRVFTVRETETASAALERLRDAPGTTAEVYVVDGEQRLAGAIPIHRLALASRDARIATLVDPTPGAVSATVTREELVEYLTRTGLPSIAVVGADGALLGVLRHAALVGAAEAEAVMDLQRMVGVSVDEKALSPIGFAVKKRLPWLNINLLTAFLAAAVVGLFENTIATVSALAVMLPVVAGQSGNSGAQALAVTMRGLALREVRASHWRRLAFKEAMVGMINGFAIAIVAAIGVLVWSGSIGLALVIAVSMVIAMAAANFAGASIPIMLKRFGQDPAQSASIFLTTVTDIVGFFVFLGLATLAIEML
ncbi:MAG: magnesium transporter [Deltaproteobacteria bacterium]|nr:magnesium transporter [Deltaproteobacteria bacterium]